MRYAFSKEKWLYVGLLMFMCVYFSTGCSTQAEGTLNPNKKTVTVAKVLETEEQTNVNVTGEVVSLLHTSVSFEIGGKINSLSVEEGQFVQRNQTLATLDNRDYIVRRDNAQLQYQVSETKYEKLLNGSRAEEIQQTEKEIDILLTQLEQAQNNYVRTKRLVEDGALPQVELENSEASLQIIQAQLAKAQIALSLQLDGAREEDIELQKLEKEIVQNSIREVEQIIEKTMLASPIEGIISRKLTEIGETVSAGLPIVEITQMNPLYIKVDVPARILTQIELNDTVDVYLPELQQSVEGIITKKHIIANAETKNFLVEIRIANHDYSIFPGLLAEVQLISITEKGVWIPTNSVINRGENQPYVFVYDEQTNQVKQRNVTIDKMKEEMLLVTEGLSPEEQIVIQGAAFVADGEAVQVWQEEGATR